MQIAKGNVVMSLNEKDVEVFYEVTNVFEEKDATWICLAGMVNKSVVARVPLLFLEKQYMRVSDSTSKVLFGSKNNEKS
jgi:hypothetical protein